MDNNERIALLKKAVAGKLTDEEKTMVEAQKAEDDDVTISSLAVEPPSEESAVTDEMIVDAREAEYRHRKMLGEDYE